MVGSADSFPFEMVPFQSLGILEGPPPPGLLNACACEVASCSALGGQKGDEAWKSLANVN